MLQVVNKDATHKALLTASVAKVQFVEDAIKNDTVVETVSGVIDTATFPVKEDLDECIHHIQSAWPIDREWLLRTLCTSRTRFSLRQCLNALTDMAGLAWWMWPLEPFTRGSVIQV